MSEQWVLVDTTRSRQHEDLTVFWGPDRKGYTTCLVSAGKYSASDAEELRTADTIPVPLGSAQWLSNRVVYWGNMLDILPVYETNDRNHRRGEK